MLDAFFLGLHHLLHHLQQLSHGTAGIVYEDKCGARLTIKGDVAVHQYDARVRFVQVGKVLLIAEKAERTRFSRLNGRYIAHRYFRIANHSAAG